jgi:ABC-2 type transport system permease protein
VKNVWIVLVAEVKRRLTSRAFQIGVVVGMLGVAAMIKLPALVAANVGADQTKIVLAGAPRLTARARTLLSPDFTIAAVRTDISAPTAAELDRLHAGRLIVLQSDGSSLRATVYAKNSQTVSAEHLGQLLAPLGLEIAQHVGPAQSARLLAVPVTVRGVTDAFATPESAAVAHLLGFALLVVLYLVIILNSQLTLNSVIEEKTNRIAELLVAAIDPLALLYGKIAAGTVLAVVQMLAWGVAAFLAGGGLGASGALGAGGAPALHGGESVSLIAAGDAIKPFVFPGFVFLLFVGLLQFSTIYAAIGSLVSRPEDLGSMSSALIVPIVAAFVTAILAFDAPNAPFVVVASFVPLIAPFVMFVRIVMDDPPLWQLLLCAAINLAVLWFVAVAAGRLYRVGMLLYGRPPTLAQVWKTVREG